MPTLVSPYSGSSREVDDIFIAAVLVAPHTDNTLNSCAAVVAKEGSRVTFWEEIVGRVDELPPLLVNKKDEYDVKRILVGKTEWHFIRLLWDIDGLTHYKIEYVDKNVTIYKEKHPEKVWPRFRSHKCIASVSTFPEFVCNVEVGETLLQRGLRNGQIAVNTRGCPVILKSIQPGFSHQDIPARVLARLVAAYAALILTVEVTNHEPRLPYKEFYL